MDRVRALGVGSQAPDGFVGATFGFRRSGDALTFLALSTWESIEAISEATGGRPDANLPSQPIRGDLDVVTIDLFELAEGPPLPLSATSGGALGIVWARVSPRAEAAAQQMIRAVAPEVGAAGVAGLQMGRRVLAGKTELLVVALWRDRVALHEFAQHRARGTLDPTFLKLLTDWRFETYDCLGPGASTLPSPGPAILLADSEARYLDASPGVETLLDVPAELVLRQTLADLTPPELRADVDHAWAAFLAAGEASGTFEILLPNGERRLIAFRAVTDCPRPGIHASVLSAPDAPPDVRSVRDIVADAFPEASFAAA